jgi:RNA polymerase sigma-70 factor, ECF subfamily
VTQIAVAVRARPARRGRPVGRRVPAPNTDIIGTGTAALSGAADRRLGASRATASEPRVATAPVPRLDTEEGIRVAYRQHGAVLLHHAELSLHDRGLAEEAVQETFVRAWRHADRYDPNLASLRTWLFAILRNVVIDMARARSIRPSLATEPERLDAHGTAVHDDTDAVLTTWELTEALDKLSEEHRRAIVETHLRSRSYTDVAAELGVPVGTVRSRVFYGLRALRAVLEERAA